jgi:hypothetical protein
LAAESSPCCHAPLSWSRATCNGINTLKTVLPTLTKNYLTSSSKDYYIKGILKGCEEMNKLFVYLFIIYLFVPKD